LHALINVSIFFSLPFFLFLWAFGSSFLFSLYTTTASMYQPRLPSSNIFNCRFYYAQDQNFTAQVVLGDLSVFSTQERHIGFGPLQTNWCQLLGCMVYAAKDSGSHGRKGLGNIAGYASSISALWSFA